MSGRVVSSEPSAITRGQWLAIATVVEHRFGPRHSLTIACWTAYDNAPIELTEELTDD